MVQPPDDDTSNIIWKTNVLDNDELDALQKNPVNRIPSFHTGYKIVAVYNAYAHRRIKYHSQFYNSDYGTSYWPCVVGNSPGVEGFDIYINSEYLKHFLETHARDVEYWQHL